MSTMKPINAYKETQVKTASGGRLVVMLYDEAIKQMDAAVGEMAKEKPFLDKVHNHIVRTQDILTELMASLDFENGKEIANNLFSLYMFFNQQLTQANLKKDKELIKPVRKGMADLRESWAAIQNTSINAPEPARGINIAG